MFLRFVFETIVPLLMRRCAFALCPIFTVVGLFMCVGVPNKFVMLSYPMPLGSTMMSAFV